MQKYFETKKNLSWGGKNSLGCVKYENLLRMSEFKGIVRWKMIHIKINFLIMSHI